MSDNELIDGVHNIDMNDDIATRHKKERKNLQAQIQKLKKTAGKGDKKKKKEVQEEIEQLEADLDRKHAQELATVDSFVPRRQADSDKEDAAEHEAADEDSLTANNQTQRVSKAQKRRDKKAQEEKERQANILAHEEINKNGPRQVESDTIKKCLQSRQLALHPIPSDGDCLYNAVCHQLNITGRKPIDTPTLRRLTAEYVAVNKDSLIFYMSNPDTGDELTDEEFEKYCDAIRNTKAWGGHIEIKAIAEILKAPIEVLQATGPPTIQGEQQFRKPNLVITYHRHMYSLGEHYNGTKPASAVDPDEEAAV